MDWCRRIPHYRIRSVPPSFRGSIRTSSEEMGIALSVGFTDTDPLLNDARTPHSLWKSETKDRHRRIGVGGYQYDTRITQTSERRL